MRDIKSLYRVALRDLYRPSGVLVLVAAALAWLLYERFGGTG